MTAEHNRPDGLYHGYYCMICGLGGVNMLGQGRDGHRSGEVNCTPDPALVKTLRELNK